MMKKIIVLLLTLLLIISLSSCGLREETKDNQTPLLKSDKKVEVKEEVKGTIALDLNKVEEAKNFSLKDNTGVKGQKENDSFKDLLENIKADGDGEFYTLPVFFSGQKVTHTNGIFVISEKSTKIFKSGITPDTIDVYLVYHNKEDKLLKMKTTVKVKLYESNNRYLMSTQLENPDKINLEKDGSKTLAEFVIINK